MKSNNIKVVDQNKIDRNANLMFAFDLEGSEYVAYSIERDDDESNLFVSKTIKNGDGTSSLLDIDAADEKAKLSEIVKMLVSKAVKDDNDKFIGDSVVLANDRVVKFVTVFFNKEQNMSIDKTYVATVGKNVTRVVNEYYSSVSMEEPKIVEEVFPTLAPLTQDAKDDDTSVVPTAVNSTDNNSVAFFEEPKVESDSATAAISEQSNVSGEEPIVEGLKDDFVAFGTESTIPQVEAAPIVFTPEDVVVQTPEIVEPITIADSVVSEVKAEPILTVPEVSLPSVDASVVEPVNVTVPVMETPEPKVDSVVVGPLEQASPVVSEPVLESNIQPLVFNASKETNLNAALGEVAKDTVIPVENIEPVREFGVDEPAMQVVQQQSGISPMVQPQMVTDPKTLSRKAGFANNKFFMVIAIAFFLASCVFLGYEVFNYFQLTK